MTGYVRKDTTNNIADGNVINAADLDSEFDGVQDAFNASTGHKHDGTAGEGATINALGPTQDVTVSATLVAPKTTNTIDIGSSALKFKDLFLAGNSSIGGTLAVTGVATLTAQPILSSLTASSAVATDASKGLVSVTNTGTGNNVLATSPTLVTPILGIPQSATLTNATGLPLTTGVTGTLPVANGGTGLTAGTSGGVLAYTATGTLASSAALAASALVIGGGAGAAPSTTTTGTGVVTALGVNVGTAGAFVVNGGVLGTPASGTVTNLTGTASININGTVGATTATTGAFTTLAASGGTSLATSSGTVGVGGAAGAQTLTVSKTSLTNPITIGAVSDSNTYGQLSFNGVFTAAGVLGINAGADANLYLSAPTGGTVQQKINNVKISEVSSTGLAVTGTLSATGTTTVGIGGTGANDGIVVLNGSSALNQGSYINFRKNSVDKIYIGTGSSVIGGTLDSLCLSALVGAVTTYANGTKVSDIDKDKSLALQGATSQTGTGITFPATQNASANANTLDDYEEGTWTPVFTPSAGAYTTLTYSQNSGTYTKIGRSLTLIFVIEVSAYSVGTASGTLTITGLPSPVASHAWAAGGIARCYNFALATDLMPTRFIMDTASVLRIETNTMNASGPTAVGATEIKAGTGIYGSITYFTA